MAENNLRFRFLGQLHRLGPIFTLLKWGRRKLMDAYVASMRRVPEWWVTFGAARGVYSELVLLSNGQVAGNIILDHQETSKPGPASLRTLAKLGQAGHQPWPIFWTLRKNARLVGPTLALRDHKKRLALEAVYDVHSAKDPASSWVSLPKARRLNGNWTSIVSLWCCRETYFNYYHWLMDGLPRLAALSHFPEDTRILVPHDLPKFCWDSLNFLNLQDRVRETSECHLEIENYFFSNPTAMTGCENPHAIEFLRRSFLHFADQSYQGPVRFYIRRKGKTRGIHQEILLFEVLQEKGWPVIDLEDLNLAQQIALFSRAKAIIGAHGAGFTNLIWCQPGCVAVELFASSFMNGCYESIACTVGIAHQFMIFPSDLKNQIHIDVKEFSKLLDDVDLSLQ